MRYRAFCESPGELSGDGNGNGDGTTDSDGYSFPWQSDEYAGLPASVAYHMWNSERITHHEGSVEPTFNPASIGISSYFANMWKSALEIATQQKLNIAEAASYAIPGIGPGLLANRLIGVDRTAVDINVPKDIKNTLEQPTNNTNRAVDAYLQRLGTAGRKIGKTLILGVPGVGPVVSGAEFSQGPGKDTFVTAAGAASTAGGAAIGAVSDAINPFSDATNYITSNPAIVLLAVGALLLLIMVAK